jgi:hypothetical protein
VVTVVGRKQVHSAHLIVTGAHVPDCTVLRAWVTDGPAAARGRVSVLTLTDGEVRAFLAVLALHPHWAAAIRALAQHPVVAQAESRAMPLNSPGKRLALDEAMQLAMTHAAQPAPP